MTDPRYSKYKYMLGELKYDSKSKFDDLKASIQTLDGNVITANSKWMAVSKLVLYFIIIFSFQTPWASGGGGSVYVTGAKDFKRADIRNIKLIGGHKGPITDLDFSPFHDNILATASQDSTVKIWMIPDGGITETTSKCDADLMGHGKKVSLLKFHPTAEFLMATGSIDQSIKIWDVQNEKSVLELQLEKDPICMNWNFDGSRLGAMTKDIKMTIYDPRQAEAAQTFETHQGIKGGRFTWLGDSQKLMTQGFSSYGERQWAIFDSRNTEKPLAIKTLDNNNNVIMNLHFDSASSIVYMVNRGSAATQFWYYTEENGSPELKVIEGKYTGNNNNHGMYFLPTSNVEFMKNELQFAIRHAGTFAEYVSFKVKRAGNMFQSELYPAFKSGDSSL